jgi:hypothetical protein
MGTFSELSMTENPIGEAFISEASISKASDAAVGDVSPHSAPTDVTADDICTSKAPTIDAPTETPAHNVASSDVAIYEPSAHQVTSASSESTAPSKKTRRGRNDPEPDWSARMREKVKKSKNRIGQACDRCKVCPPTLLVPQ